MAYTNNLSNYTTQTTPATPYAYPPAVVCDFGWYSSLSTTIFGNLSYSYSGNVYPPPNAGRTWPNPNTVDYVTQINTGVTFDCLDSPGLGLPKLIVPSGITIVNYSWNLGNGQIAQGPIVSTTYTQRTPDGACTLSVTDNLGRVTSTTRRLNFIVPSSAVGAFSKSVT